MTHGISLLDLFGVEKYYLNYHDVIITMMNYHDVLKNRLYGMFGFLLSENRNCQEIPFLSNGLARGGAGVAITLGCRMPGDNRMTTYHAQMSPLLYLLHKMLERILFTRGAMGIAVFSHRFWHDQRAWEQTGGGWKW